MPPIIQDPTAFDHETRLQQERLWHTNHGFQHDHPLNKWPFYSKARNEYAWYLVSACLTPLLRELGATAESKVLLSPSGWGGDIPHIKPVTNKIVGVDISYEALQKNDPSITRITADIKHLPFVDECFDFVVISGFLHHVVDEEGGYKPYVEAMSRVLKRGGWMVTIEPSALFPIMWITVPLRRKVFGEITGQLPYERAISSLAVQRCFREIGLKNVFARAASYCHPRLFLPVAKLMAKVQPFIGRLPVLRHFGFFVTVSGQKC